jgi:hypothetical protein
VSGSKCVSSIGSERRVPKPQPRISVAATLLLNGILFNIGMDTLTAIECEATRATTFVSAVRDVSDAEVASARGERVRAEQLG